MFFAQICYTCDVHVTHKQFLDKFYNQIMAIVECALVKGYVSVFKLKSANINYIYFSLFFDTLIL